MAYNMRLPIYGWNLIEFSSPEYSAASSFSAFPLKSQGFHTKYTFISWRLQLLKDMYENMQNKEM